MRQLFAVALVAICLFTAGCSQDQPPAQAPPKTEAKPAVEPAAPAPAPAPAPAVTPTAPAPQPPPPQEPPKPAPPVASEPAKQPAPPAPAEAKPAPAPTAAKPIDVVGTIILEASQGKVTLPHLAHAKLFPCATCHGDGTPGKIDLTKDTAHELCRDCHKAKGAGPTTCAGCHKK